MKLGERTREKLVQLYPDVAVRAIQLYNSFATLHGRTLRCTESIRTFERQKELYAQGRTAPGRIVTNSKPGYSIHHFGCALDSCFPGVDPYLTNLDPKTRSFLWDEYGRLAIAHGFVWGGDWNGNGKEEANDFDLPHIQLTYGLPLDELRRLYSVGGMEAVWADFDRIRGVKAGGEWGFPYSQTKITELGGLPE